MVLSFEQVKVKLASYCAYQERCSHEVLEKLKAYSLTEDEMIDLMRWLSKERYLDDLRFAKEFVHGKFYIKKWGRVKINFELRKKGIIERFISRALVEEINEEDYRSTAILLAEKKFVSLGRSLSPQAQKKILSYLQQKGFEWNIVKECLEEVIQHEKNRP